MQPKNKVLVTVGIMLGMLLAALEALVVTAAMPTIVNELKGLDIYSLVFSIYLFTSTLSMPIWGKLSDLYGRGRCFQIAILVFLFGCLLCGISQSMIQLVIFRAIQGIGAGGITPITQIIIGEIYTLSERSRMQILFSGLWVIASFSGPFIGGYITEVLSWHWIFYLNIPFGLLAALITKIGLKETINKSVGASAIDKPGAIVLSIGIVLLLLACSGNTWQISDWVKFIFAFISLCFFIVFLLVEKTSVEPLLPLSLFREKVFLVSVIANFLVGISTFGSIPFLTLYAQVVLRTKPSEVGLILVPLMLGWVLVSIIAGRLILSVSYRKIVITGMFSIVVGFCFLMLLLLNNTKTQLYISSGAIGIGLGFSMVTLIIAVQNTLLNNIGVTTSSILFSRNIGGVIGTTIMGAFMNWKLDKYLCSFSQSNITDDKNILSITSNINSAMDAINQSSLPENIMLQLQPAFAGSINTVFIFAFFISLAALVTVFMLPKGLLVSQSSSLDINHNTNNN